MLTLEYWIYAVLLAALAVCWADILVRPGMLLTPVQAWLRNKYRWCDASGHPRFVELDDQWWWKPLWGCYKCVAGQWGFWGYLFLLPLAHYSLLAHLGFTAITIILAYLFHKWSLE